MKFILLFLFAVPVFAGTVINSYIKYPPTGGSSPVTVVEEVEWVGTTDPSGAFTPPGNSLLVASIRCKSPNGDGSTLMIPTTSGLTWTKRAGGTVDGVSANVVDVWIFTSPVGASPGSMTVSMNKNHATCSKLVYSVEGYDAASPIGGTVTSRTTDAIDVTDWTAALSASSTANDAVFLVAAGLSVTAFTAASGWTAGYLGEEVSQQQSAHTFIVAAKDDVELGYYGNSSGQVGAWAGIVVNAE